MKKIVLLVVLALLGVITYFVFYSKKSKPHGDEVRQRPVNVSKHTEDFSTSFNAAMNDYYALTEAFVGWDSAAIQSNTAALKRSLGSINLDELKKDTVIHETAVSYAGSLVEELSAISSQPDITSRRRAFHTFSQNYYDLLRTVKYDGATIYLQECPMAFEGDQKNGVWLSNKAEIRNPYLGLHHPKYKSGMLICGETKDSLNFQNQTLN
ncbi:MAG: DUF3347 domain-containing protein [Chitinophagaceae bacterium]